MSTEALRKWRWWTFARHRKYDGINKPGRSFSILGWWASAPNHWRGGGSLRANWGPGALIRAATLSTGLLIGAGLDVEIFDAHVEALLWTFLKWTAIIVPLVVVLSIPRAPLPGWTWSSTAARSKPRILAVSWLLTGLILPWILAWLVADAAGRWFTDWWTQAHQGGGPGIYLWGVWLLTGVITYTVASAVGVLTTFLIDQRLAAFGNGRGNRHA